MGQRGSGTVDAAAEGDGVTGAGSKPGCLGRCCCRGVGQRAGFVGGGAQPQTCCFGSRWMRLPGCHKVLREGGQAGGETCSTCVQGVLGPRMRLEREKQRRVGGEGDPHLRQVLPPRRRGLAGGSEETEKNPKG